MGLCWSTICCAVSLRYTSQSASCTDWSGVKGYLVHKTQIIVNKEYNIYGKSKYTVHGVRLALAPCTAEYLAGPQKVHHCTKTQHFPSLLPFLIYVYKYKYIYVYMYVLYMYPSIKHYNHQNALRKVFLPNCFTFLRFSESIAVCCNN